MGRTVFEVTKMSSKVKARLMQKPSQIESDETLPEVKVGFYPVTDQYTALDLKNIII